MTDKIALYISHGLYTMTTNLLLFLFYKKIYEAKYNSKAVYIVSYIISTIIYIFINYLSEYLGIPIINTIYSFIYFNAICALLFKSSLKKSFMYNSLYFIVLVFIEVSTVALGTIFKGNSLNELLSNDQYLVISYTSNTLIMILAWQVFVSILSKNELRTVKYKQLILSGIFTAFAVFVEHIFSMRIMNKKDGIFTIFILLGFLFLSVFIVYFTNEINRSYNISYEAKIIKKQSELQLANYIETRKKYEESRKTIHDIKKHLATLSMLKSTDDKRAYEYSRIIEKQVDSLMNGFQCSNTILSIIMSQKILIAESENIKVGTKVEDIAFDYISDVDMTAIFANLWDNAIEACLNIEKSERFINVIIGRVNDFIVISFENSFDGVILNKNGKLLSTKENHEGVGVSIIKSALGKYDGIIKMAQDENIFKSEILIPIS